MHKIRWRIIKPTIAACVIQLGLIPSPCHEAARYVVLDSHALAELFAACEGPVEMRAARLQELQGRGSPSTRFICDMPGASDL